jgi:hypothetical protein
VLRHEFRASQLSDASKDASSRLSLALDEHKALAATWEVERQENECKLSDFYFYLDGNKYHILFFYFHSN